MASKKTKWIIGLSSVAAFTGFIGFLNGTTSTGNSQQTAYNQSGGTSELPSSQNPFAQEDGSQIPSNGSNGSYTTPDDGSGSSDSSGSSYSSGSSDSWAGDYQEDSSSDTSSDSSGGTTTDPNSGSNNFSGGSFQAPPTNGSTTESGDLRSHSS
ncbi:hypothetical protein [Niallia sp. FSL R7-0271]|uniref:hypothetical protein n=1 Tax=Niallia sp. FSL R7-0271 TaxID=2921678 RepID=UPI0030FCC9F1